MKKESSPVSSHLALVVTTHGLAWEFAVTRQPAHLPTLVATDERPGADLATAEVESVTVTGPAGPGALVSAVQDGLTLGNADLIERPLVALNLLDVSTWKFLLHHNFTSSCRAVVVRAVNTTQQLARMTTVPHFLATFPASEELRLLPTFHCLSVSTHGYNFIHRIGTGTTLLEAFPLAFVLKLAVLPHFTADLQNI